MLFDNTKPDHTLSQTELAYNYLLNKILSCEYLPGQEISEKMLNDQLSFGRTPIREALVTLKSQNLITVYPRKGMQIRPFTKKYINEIYQIRKLMEPNVIRQFKMLIQRRGSWICTAIWNPARARMIHFFTRRISNFICILLR